MAMYKNLECRRNGTDLTFESRQNESSRNGSRRNGSRRNGSRRNGNTPMGSGGRVDVNQELRLLWNRKKSRRGACPGSGDWMDVTQDKKIVWGTG